ncbi:hypothetical protein Taro_022282 [Colocasia esculenta]|uniref:Uncharacterized protein n=1 Tax=Colocasia esculenta TaxID=4460 RepID=A0A843UTZ6_COLES|nr:hypothetical protein [Colocasia esculenta]
MIGQTYLAKVVSTQPSMVSTQWFRTKAEMCRKDHLVSTLVQGRSTLETDSRETRQQASISGRHQRQVDTESSQVDTTDLS